MLHKLMWEDNLTFRDIQSKYGINQRIISCLAKYYSIPINTKATRYNANAKKIIKISEDELIYLYCENGLSIRQIAEMYHCNHAVITKRLRDLNIDIRSAFSPEYYDNRRKTLEQSIEDKNGVWEKEKNGYLRISHERQHRYVMEQHLGRKLSKEEHVHHIDFDKDNNSLDNLFLFPTNQIHLSYHGYLRKHEYIHPQKFLDYYMKEIDPKLNDQEWLYDQYVIQNKSINQISKDLNVSRVPITNRLKESGIFYLRQQITNQHDATKEIASNE